ncbi:RNA polymerase sigma factor [Desulfobacterales bacterium HSG17]|nr:RNA polymerase sigma factor [Desulfobacterales bacterium HSG17]
MNTSSEVNGIFKQEIVGFLPKLKRFALSVTRDDDTANDLVQSTCEKALEKKTQYRRAGRLDSWLYRIAYTIWIDRVRRRKTRFSKLKLLKQEHGVPRTHCENSFRVEKRLDLQKALDCLTDDQRAAVLMVMVEGFSYTEVGEILNIPPGTVASRVARARSVLNSYLIDNKPIISVIGQKYGDTNDAAI